METLWIDAFDFHEYNGWTLDTQFTHLTGSSYLMATGAGVPVADAKTRFNITENSMYRMWVLSKNWIPEHSPGTFEVHISTGQGGKQKLGEKRVFGAQKESDWSWEDGGILRLVRGLHRISLHDKTGFYGRCAVIIITSDMGYAPPDGAENILAERRRLKGGQETVTGEFDLAVAGAGIAGVCAAVAAARKGLKVALLSDRPVVGGNASDECGVSMNGAGLNFEHAREMGVVGEITEAHQRNNRHGYTKACREVIDPEEHLTLFENCRVMGVNMKSGKVIESLNTIDPRDGTPGIIGADQFIDATGDGWLGYYAGAEYRFGRESRDEFGEDLAPEKADNVTMSGCIMHQCCGYRAEELDEAVSYTAPDWAPRFGPDQLKHRGIVLANGTWWMEHDNAQNDLEKAEEARDELIKITFGYWGFVKNQWEEKQKAEKFRLVRVPIVNARRESRRLMGDYILKQEDVQTSSRFPDRISYGGWGIDIHNPKGIYAKNEGPFEFNGEIKDYTVPYRCLYSKNIDNLFLSGRAVSVTHIALGTIRVQSTLGTLGQAAGTAAALCKKYDTTPRGIYENHMTELQQILTRDDHYIPGIVNEDENDIAKTASVSASSVQPFRRFGRDLLCTEWARPLTGAQTWVIPVSMLEGRLDAFSIYCCTASSCKLELSVSEYDINTENMGKELKRVRQEVESHAELWVRFALELNLGSEFVAVTLEPESEATLFGNDYSVPGVTGHRLGYATEPELKIEADYNPGNVINGITREIKSDMNMWMSDRTKILPQDIELSWDTPQEFNHVQLVFDTDTTSPRLGSLLNPGVSPFCVKEYELAFFNGGEWKTITEVTGNQNRMRRHDFDTVNAQKLRLRVKATHGDPSARVFEVRVYKK